MNDFIRYLEERLEAQRKLQCTWQSYLNTLRDCENRGLGAFDSQLELLAPGWPAVT